MRASRLFYLRRGWEPEPEIEAIAQDASVATIEGELTFADLSQMIRSMNKYGSASPGTIVTRAWANETTSAPTT
jgi:hypothetical protein